MKFLPLTLSAFRVILIVMFAAANGRGEGSVNIDVTIDSNFADNEIYYIGDLDPRAIGSGVRIFSLDVTNNSDDFNCVLRVTLFHGTDVIADGVSDSFFFQMGDRLLVDNQVIQQNHAQTELGVTVDMSRYDFQFDFLDHVTGNMLPAGTYRVVVQASEVNVPNPVAFGENSFTVTNPDAVWLLSPLNHVGVPTATPVFAWNSTAQRYRIRVCKAEDGQISGDDVITNEPVWEYETNQSIEQYPVSVARPLIEGETYYWQVSAVVNTSQGLREFPSEIWRFSYNGEDDEQFNQELFEALQLILPDNADAIMAQLNGYYVNGPVLLDGVPVDQRVFQEFLQRIMNGEYELSDIQLQ